MLTRAVALPLAIALLIPAISAHGDEPEQPPQAPMPGSANPDPGDAAAIDVVQAEFPGAFVRPNFVVVLTDDQDPASLEVMPKVRRDLGAEGVTFEDAFASVPLCCPSRASLLTGQYAHNHGVVSNEPPDGGFEAFEDDNTLPVWLHDAGYRTGYVGKYLNLYGWTALGNDPTYVPPGWSSWTALTKHTEYQMYDYSINQDGLIETFGHSPGDYQTDVLADKAEEFVAASVERRHPFFLEVAPTAPHDEGALEGKDAARSPRPAPRDEGTFDDLELPREPSFDEADVSDKPRFLRHDARLSQEKQDELEVLYRSRQESLLAVDDLVHRLVVTLKRSHELDNTVFVFTSDNGYMLGQHRQTGKESVYEESAGVPLVVRGPGFGSGEVSTQPVSNVDLVATIVEQSGIEPGVPLDGVQLERAVRGRRAPVLIEVLTERRFAAIRTARYVLAEYDSGGAELYDLVVDPFELENLRQDPSYRGIRRSLSERLDRLRGCAGVACR